MATRPASQPLGLRAGRDGVQESYPGLIALRLSQQDKPHVLSVLAHLVPLLEQEPLEQHLWIVEERRVRIRG
jgi:hypothetical protein